MFYSYITIYRLSICFILTIFDVSIEDERVYGILCIEVFPQQRSHIISSDILYEIGLPCSTFYSNVYKIKYNFAALKR